MLAAKDSIEIKRATLDLHCLSEIKTWTFVLNRKHQALFLGSQAAGQNCINTLQSKHIPIAVIFFPVAMTGCHL